MAEQISQIENEFNCSNHIQLAVNDMEDGEFRSGNNSDASKEDEGPDISGDE